MACALLQDDYGQVELMARDRQKEVESLSEELTELRSSAASHKLQVSVCRLHLFVLLCEAETCYVYTPLCSRHCHMLDINTLVTIAMAVDGLHHCCRFLLPLRRYFCFLVGYFIYSVG